MGPPRALADQTAGTARSTTAGLTRVVRTNPADQPTDPVASARHRRDRLDHLGDRLQARLRVARSRRARPHRNAIARRRSGAAGARCVRDGASRAAAPALHIHQRRRRRLGRPGVPPASPSRSHDPPGRDPIRLTGLSSGSGHCSSTLRHPEPFKDTQLQADGACTTTPTRHPGASKSGCSDRAPVPPVGPAQFGYDRGGSILRPSGHRSVSPPGNTDPAR